MEIRHIRYFKILAEELHFGRAAKRLFISQPPLSRQIKELEDELQVILFNRNNKRVELTEAGKYYRDACDEILLRLEKATQVTKQIYQADTGVFNLGYISSIPKAQLSEVLKQITELHPHLHVRLFETSSNKQLLALEQGRLDLGIVRAPILRPTLTQYMLYEDSFILAIPLDYDKQKVLRNMDQSVFVGYNSSYAPNYYQKFLEICYRLGFTPKVRHECNTVQSILELVQYGVGIAIVPASVQLQSNNLDVQFVDLGINIHTQIVMAYDPKNQHRILPEFQNIITAIIKK